MAIGEVTVYNEHTYRTYLQQFDYLGGTMKAALLLNSYVPNLAVHKVWGDVSAHEIEDGDYADKVLAAKTITQDGSGRTVMSHANLDFGSDVDITAKYLVRYLDGGTKYLWSYVDLNVGGGNLVVTSGPLVISVNAAGVYRIEPNA